MQETGDLTLQHNPYRRTVSAAETPAPAVAGAVTPGAGRGGSGRSFPMVRPAGDYVSEYETALWEAR